MENPALSRLRTKCVSRNVPESINSCQMGFSNSSQFRDDFMKLKLEQLHCTEVCVTKFSELYRFVTNTKQTFICSLVSPYKDTFACSWMAGEYPRQSLIVGIYRKNYGRKLFLNEPSTIGYPIYSQEIELVDILKNSYLMDICHMENVPNHIDSLLTVSQHIYGTCSHVQLKPRSHSLARLHNIYRCSMRMGLHKACNVVWNANIQKLSLGTNSGIVFTTLSALFGEMYQIFCPSGHHERFTLPYVQRFNNSGNSLYFGFKDGHVTSLDTRSFYSGFKSDIMIGDGITGLQFLQDDHTMIVGGWKDKLCCVDTRMNSVVFDYPGHRTRSLKTDFHLDESYGVLCSSGRDYVTRYWDLKQGKLLTEVPINFPNKKGLFIYSTVHSSGSQLHSYTFSGNKICYQETYPDYY